MAKTIRIEDLTPQAEVKLSRGRKLTLRRPGFRTRRQIPWAAQRPGWGNASAAADAVLLRATSGSLCKAGLGELGKRDRHRLMLGTVRLSGGANDWRRLHGTSLTFDERFLATMIWAERREAREAQDSLRKIRERLVEQAVADLGAIPRMNLGIAGLGKQLAAVNSFSRMAKAATMFSNVQTPALAGFGTGLTPTALNVNFGVNSAISEMAKTSFSALGMRSFATPGISKAWESAAMSAGLKADMSRVVNQIGALPVARDLMAGTRAQDYLSAFSSNSHFRFPLGIAAIGRQWDFGGSAIAKQFEFALGSRPFSAGLKNMQFLGGDLPGLLPGLDKAKLGMGADILRSTQGVIESLLIVEMARLWSDDPLWFLIAQLNPRKLPALLDASREDVFEAVLDGLERVVRDSTLIEQLIEACESIGFLSSEQRLWLSHGLMHAHQGDWVQAMPPLILGFEGAIFNGAIAAEVIAGREGKKLPAEKVIKAINLDDDLEAFAIRLVFGGSGNATRHGRPENEMRDQALPLIVALIGWLDFTLGSSATTKLAGGLEESLTDALGSSGRRELVAAS